MKAFLSLFFSLIILNSKTLDAQVKPALKFPGTPFQGTKQYCDLKPLKYKVTIKGYDVTIVEYYKNEKPTIVTGTYKRVSCLQIIQLRKNIKCQERTTQFIRNLSATATWKEAILFSLNYADKGKRKMLSRMNSIFINWFSS
jgi:hypothetical protein